MTAPVAWFFSCFSGASFLPTPDPPQTGPHRTGPLQIRARQRATRCLYAQEVLHAVRVMLPRPPLPWYSQTHLRDSHSRKFRFGRCRRLVAHEVEHPHESECVDALRAPGVLWLRSSWFHRRMTKRVRDHRRLLLKWSQGRRSWRGRNKRSLERTITTITEPAFVVRRSSGAGHPGGPRSAGPASS